MALSAAVVSVGATATQLSSADTDSYAGTSLIVSVPTGGSTIYVGGSGVTSAAGYPVAAGVSLPVNALNAGDVVYAITASGSQNVNVLSAGV